MSVLIKNMEMPEHCGYCRFRYDGICHALQKTQYSEKECPLVSVNDKSESVPSAQSEAKWIPVKTRPMDEEEKRYWEEHYGYTFGEDYDGIMFDCLMPEDEQEVWVCSKSGNVWQDTCEVDIGFGLEGNGDWDDIVAWMPFERPEPWKGEDGVRHKEKGD